MAKHRAPRYVRTKHVIAKAPVAAGATAIGLGVLTTSPANAATPHDWSGVAQCESSGNWSIDTGNGYFGGLQFSPSTWAGYGGTTFAARADLASPAQQVQIAEKVLASQGPGAWPVCGRYLTGGTTQAATRQAATPAPTTTTTTDGDHDGDHDGDDAAAVGRQTGSGGDYTVVSGDTVATIAAAHSEPWRQLYQDNRSVIGADPNLIFPGQRLTTAPAAAAPAAQAPAAPAPAAQAPAAPAPVTASVAQAPAVHAPAVQAPAVQAPAPAPAATAVAAAAPAAAPAASSAGAVAAKVALEQVGRPYVYGGVSPSGFDCSGLAQYAYAEAGVSIPRTTGAQSSAGTEVSQADLQVGDLVFFYGGTHVGIYVGNGQVVHAPVPGDVVKVTPIAYMPFYTARHIG